MSGLQDHFGRRFSYLRLSLTDACNFRCVYCLPHGYRKIPGAAGPLEIEEICNLVQAFAEMGTVKVRLTGGEPTLRPDLLEIARVVSGVRGIHTVALSTNGYRLSSLASQLYSAGIRKINVSIDSLDRERFHSITGVDRLNEVLEGIEVALASGFPSVKVNVVLMAGRNEDDFPFFLQWVKNKPVTVRFIELMLTGKTDALFREHHLSAEVLHEKLLKTGWCPRVKNEADGPAIEFDHPDYLGRIGLIAPYSKDFCSSCNRLRVTSQGGLRLCLFGEGNHDIRPWLQSSRQKEDLKAEVHALLKKKEISHYLPQGRYGNNQSFSAIGG